MEVLKMEMMLWNTLLTTFIGLVAWNLKEKAAELSRITILLNKTREEIARDNVTQAEIDKIVAHLDARFDKLNDKIDGFMKEQRSALN
jgi:predicted O-methyltransferase YrrM